MFDMYYFMLPKVHMHAAASVCLSDYSIVREFVRAIMQRHFDGSCITLPYTHMNQANLRRFHMLTAKAQIRLCTRVC